ncbi:MAG: guanylate kinase [Sediminibacterium sp.]|nr:guanylate kinase [Sediminibacterium sp.]MBP6145283.1 guanylate kinase [Sediminibacterium sp.]
MSEQQKKVIILTAPSGAGKTSITKFLLANHPQLAFSVSATTRAPRGAEQDGIDYHFISPAAFEGHIEQNNFLEYEMVYEGLYYGTLKSELDRIWAQGKTPVLDIDVKGAIAIQKQLGDQALSIFILPPSIEVLKERLEKRNTESAEKMQMRLDKAEYEISHCDQFNAVVKNDILETACKETATLIQDFISK